MKICVIIIFGLLPLPGFQVDTKSIDPHSIGWQGIVPLHSTRADVQRLLGAGTGESGSSYYMKNVNVFFLYSRGDCKSGRGAWNVQPDTVTRITVYPKPAPMLRDLNLDRNKFEKKPGGHIAAIVWYVNDEDGLVIEVDEDIGQVMGFYYWPQRKDNHLRCP